MRRSTYWCSSWLRCSPDARRPEPERPADLVVYGRVWTGDSAAPTAGGIAVRGGTIVAVGSKRQIGRFQGPATRVLDNGDRSVVPGFGDSHTHFINGGFQLMSVDLRDADTPAEFVRRLAEFAKRLPKGKWILGGDWDHERWPGAPLPRREWIDSVTRDHPVFVSRLDGHMGVANSAALRLAGITRCEPCAGRRRDRPRRGDRASRPGCSRTTRWTRSGGRCRTAPPREVDSALAVALRHAAENGRHHHPHDGRLGRPGGVQAGPRPERADGADLRLRAARHVADARGHGARRRSRRRLAALGRTEGLHGRLARFHDGRLLRAVPRRAEHPRPAGHRFGDDARLDPLGGQRRPPGRRPRHRRPRQRRAARLLRRSGARCTARATAASASSTPSTSGRPTSRASASRGSSRRCSPTTPSTTAAGPTSAWTPSACRGTYAFRSLLASGAHLAFGSDWTVAPLSPILGIYAAVTRRTLDGRNPQGWFPEEKLTLEQALRAYTAGVAYAGFMEGSTGTLRPRNAGRHRAPRPRPVRGPTGEPQRGSRAGDHRGWPRRVRAPLTPGKSRVFCSAMATRTKADVRGLRLSKDRAAGDVPLDAPVPAPRRQGDPAQAAEPDLLPDLRRRPRGRPGRGRQAAQARPRLVLSRTTATAPCAWRSA